MSDHDTNLGFPDYGRGWRVDKRLITVVAVSLTFASSCGLSQNTMLPQASVEIISGKDIAGAIIEPQNRGDDLTAARVIDVVLGTAETEIMSDANGNLEFTIEFPVGATITYVGSIKPRSASSAQEVAGTWTQQAEGIFGEDTGTWSVTADATGK